jgi:hypothetical protein
MVVCAHFRRDSIYQDPIITEHLPMENWESIPISLKQNAQHSNKRALACMHVLFVPGFILGHGKLHVGRCAVDYLARLY